jgi:hypothetical protein
MKQEKRNSIKEVPKETLSDNFSDLEKINVRRYLADNLKDLYKEVEEECATFKEKVFLKQLDNLEDYMVR